MIHILSIIKCLIRVLCNTSTYSAWNIQIRSCDHYHFLPDFWSHTVHKMHLIYHSLFQANASPMSVKTNLPLARSVRRLSEPMLTESGHFNNTIRPKRSTSLTPPKTYGIDLKMSVTAIKGDGDKLPGSERVTACDNM